MMIGTNRNVHETIKRMPLNSVGVELGVWKGDSSELMSQKTRKLHLVDSWSVEPYKHLETYDSYLKRYQSVTGGNTPKDFMSYYDKIYQSVVDRFQQNLNVKIWRMPTTNFFKLFDEKVDWVYVDAAHDEEGVYLDLVNTHKHLAAHGGGTIYGDDYGNKQGVVKGVDRFVAEYDLKLNNFYNNQYEIKL